MIKTCYTQKLLLFTCILFTFLNPALSYEDVGRIFHEEAASISIYEKSSPSIVAIEADLPDGMSTGTGCVVDPGGIILTSLHVIKGARSIEVTMKNGQNYKAEVVAILKDNNDLALLKIKPKSPLEPAKFGNSDSIKIGQKVLTIGNPFGFTGTLTTGIVSRIDYQRNKIQTDAAINPGCSGGPLINLKGEIIGINQSIYNPDNNHSNIGIGFAVPINDAKKFISSTTMKTPKVADAALD